MTSRGNIIRERYVKRKDRAALTAPDGRAIDKRQALPRFDYSRKNLPPVGSKALILYVDNETFEVL